MTTTPLTPHRVSASEPGVYAVALSRDWEPLCEGVEGRYADIWGVGEFAQVVVQLREVKNRSDEESA